MSNLGSEKQAIARSFAIYGDMFLKVATVSDGNRVGELTSSRISRVYIQNLEPQSVTDFDADERGYLTYCRLDVPQQRRDANGKQKAYTLTEVWDKPSQTFRRWTHEKNYSTDIEQLGTPTEELPFAAFGINFVPIVWQPFRHIGADRGMAAIMPAIDKIDQADLQATRLAEMLFRFNKPLFVAASEGRDSSGRPLAPPVLGGANGDKLELGGDPLATDVIRLPGTTSLESLVPNINYDSALNVLNAQMADISYDLPEMVYTEIHKRTDLSGVAISYMLDAATSI